MESSLDFSENKSAVQVSCEKKPQALIVELSISKEKAPSVIMDDNPFVLEDKEEPNFKSDELSLFEQPLTEGSNLFNVAKQSVSGSGSTPEFQSPMPSPDPVRSNVPNPVVVVRPPIQSTIESEIEQIEEKDHFNQFIDYTLDALDFFEAITLETKSIDVVLLDFEEGKYKSIGICLKFLLNRILDRTSENFKEMNQFVTFFYKYFEVKIVQNPPKIIELSLKATGKGIYADFDAMINGYRLLTMCKWDLDDLLDFNLKSTSPSKIGDQNVTTNHPNAYIKWYIQSTVHATFSILFFHYLLLMHKLKNLDYFADQKNIDDYNNGSLHFHQHTFRSLAKVSDFCRKQRSVLRADSFKLSVQKYYRGFFKFTDLMSNVGQYFNLLYSEYKYEGFFLDGFCGRLWFS